MGSQQALLEPMIGKDTCWVLLALLKSILRLVAWWWATHALLIEWSQEKVLETNCMLPLQEHNTEHPQEAGKIQHRYEHREEK